ncbi:hypothetical protein R1sor_001595 [Riccia sorocarpa]|uniref:F-box domain-containing protein n=1 Tax=Riccia sorocarpa TaxID=122646 RepID=A0ABD3GX91_9MARC
MTGEGCGQETKPPSIRGAKGEGKFESRVPTGRDMQKSSRDRETKKHYLKWAKGAGEFVPDYHWALSDVCRSMEQQAQSRTLKELVVMWVWLTLILLSRVLDRLLQHIAALIRQVDEQGDETDAEVNDIDEFLDCWEFALTGPDDESSKEGLETEQGLPDDLVAMQIWSLIVSSFSEMRHVNRDWRRFVTTSLEWLAMEVVRLSERFNMRGTLLSGKLWLIE